ncbi:MAG TPA: HYExAFE family protein [Phycisphaerae bacterium]|nr:HYExAFE family protein [Phycisphaerae bacterium]HNU44577.1 HYExAFE family protein [Phycisphaerae bacterium]
MAQRHHHYEAAFEDFLRASGWPYIPVNEGRQAIFAGHRVKSFDFLVYPPGNSAWLVDVKGRKFPYRTGRNRRYWENWVTSADLESLRRWETVFGTGFQAVLIFAYLLTEDNARLPVSRLHPFRDRQYAFLRVGASEYAAHARVRSSRWGTLSVPGASFRSLLRPAYEP